MKSSTGFREPDFRYLGVVESREDFTVTHKEHFFYLEAAVHWVEEKAEEFPLRRVYGLTLPSDKYRYVGGVQCRGDRQVHQAWRQLYSLILPEKYDIPFLPEPSSTLGSGLFDTRVSYTLQGGREVGTLTLEGSSEC